MISLLMFMSMLGIIASIHQSKLLGRTALIFLLWKYKLAPELMTFSYTISFIEYAFGWSASILLSLVSSILGIGQIFYEFNHLHKFQSNSQNLHLEEMEKVLNHSEKHAKAHYLHSSLHKTKAHSATIFSISDYSDKIQYYHHHKKDDTIMMEQIRDGVHILHFYDLESGRSSYQSSASNSSDHIPILGSTINTLNSNSNYLNNWQWKQRIQKTPQPLIKFNSNSKVNNVNNDLASPSKLSQDKSPIVLPYDPFERIATLSRRTSPFRFTDSKTKELQAGLNKDNTPLFDASSELMLQITPPMKEIPSNEPQSQQLKEVDTKTPARSIQFQQKSLVQ